MMKAKLKNTEFEYVLFEWENIENFSKLKHLCGNKVDISFQVSYIDDFWNVELETYNGKKTQVCSGNYVVKLGDNMFACLSAGEFDKYFDDGNPRCEDCKFYVENGSCCHSGEPGTPIEMCFSKKDETDK